MRSLKYTAAVALIAAMGLAAPASAQNLVLEGGRIIVGDGSAPIENGTVVVENGKITQVGPAARVKAPAGATRPCSTGRLVATTNSSPPILATSSESEHASVTMRAIRRSTRSP